MNCKAAQATRFCACFELLALHLYLGITPKDLRFTCLHALLFQQPSCSQPHPIPSHLIFRVLAVLMQYCCFFRRQSRMVRHLWILVCIEYSLLVLMVVYRRTAKTDRRRQGSPHNRVRCRSPRSESWFIELNRVIFPVHADNILVGAPAVSKITGTGGISAAIRCTSRGAADTIDARSVSLNSFMWQAHKP